MGQNEPSFVPREPQQQQQPQPYLPRDAQPFPPRDQQQQQPRPQPQAYAPQPPVAEADVNGLPAFITGGGPQPQANVGQNGHEPAGERGDRFGHHRRRRRRGGSGGFRPERAEFGGQPGAEGGEPGAE
jgi:hypothetical protein